MKNWINTHYKSLIIAAFLVPIITVAIVSISHVTKWYGISNPVTWAVYLSIGVEIAALSALAAISANMGSKVYFPFAIVTLVQFIGNIFFAYSYIDMKSQSFLDWVDLVSPLVSFMGVEPTDLIGHKRFLAFFAGGMLPIISLSFLHMLVKFTEEDRKESNKIIEEKKEEEVKEPETKIDASDLIAEVSKVRLSESDYKKLEEVLLNPPKPNDNLKKAVEEYQDTIEKQKRQELLIQMMEFDEKLGLYDEPFNNPSVEEPFVNDEISEELKNDNDWGGLSNEELIGDDEIISTIEPTEEEETQNFSTIEPNPENIFQNDEIPTTLSDEELKEVLNRESVNSSYIEEDYEGQFEDWGNETVPEPFETQEQLPITVDEVVDNEPVIEFTNTISETINQEIPPATPTVSEDTVEKKNP